MSSREEKLAAARKKVGRIFFCLADDFQVIFMKRHRFLMTRHPSHIVLLIIK